jgi:peptide subunit release factor 1 (eRF1)
MFEQWWLTIQPISTKRTTTSQLKSLIGSCFNYLTAQITHHKTITSQLKSPNEQLPLYSNHKRNNYLTAQITQHKTTTSLLKSLNTKQLPLYSNHSTQNNYLSTQITQHKTTTSQHKLRNEQLPLSSNHSTQKKTTSYFYGNPRPGLECAWK